MTSSVMVLIFAWRPAPSVPCFNWDSLPIPRGPGGIGHDHGNCNRGPVSPLPRWALAQPLPLWDDNTHNGMKNPHCSGKLSHSIPPCTVLSEVEMGGFSSLAGLSGCHLESLFFQAHSFPVA